MVDLIRTQRLSLRPIETNDADRVHTLFNNWNVIRRLSSPPWPYTLEDARGFVAHAAKNARGLPNTCLAIARDDVLIGGLDLRISNSEPRRSDPILGYWLGEDYWGHGYMTEAARGFLAHVFDAGISDVICSGAFADNVPSLRVQGKLGFVRGEEIMMFAKPRGGEFRHINTTLTRSRFESASAST
jgi:RimJ/RimL family protein N-acetyltransferase